MNAGRKRWTDEELIAQGQALARELGKTPTTTEFDVEPGTATANTVCRHFDNWNNFLRAAGLEINRGK